MGKKRLLGIFFAVTLCLSGGVACDQQPASTPTGPKEVVAEKAVLKGCQDPANQGNVLCQWVPVSGEGGLELMGWKSPKGTIKYQFDAQGQLRVSALYSANDPNLSLVTSSFDYDGSGHRSHRRQQDDLNGDGQIEMTEEVVLTYKNNDLIQEEITQNFPPPKPSEVLVKKYDFYIPEYNVVIQKLPDGTEVTASSLSTFAVTGKNGTPAFWEEFRKNSINDRVKSVAYGLSECLSKCIQGQPHPVTASLMTIDLNNEDGEVGPLAILLDFNANGKVDGPMDNKLTCEITYESSTKYFFMPEEFKHLRIPLAKPPRTVHCVDMNGNKSDLSYTWKPLYEALGQPEPVQP